MVAVINPAHWFGEGGELPAEPRRRAKALRVAQCIEAGGPLPRGHARATLIPCRKRPAGTACSGLLMVLKQDDDAIHAFCQVCTADEYLIYEWEDTLWANGPMKPFDVAALAAEAGLSKLERPARDIDLLLERTLALLGSHLTTTEARRIVARSASPTAMVQAILGTAAQPPAVATMERLLPVLMDLWNETPREELGGQSPDAVHAAGAAAPREPRVGRNVPCPCGSGRKYKKCCLHAVRH